MLCYRDMTFCLRKCANLKCRCNKININPTHVSEIGLPIAWAEYTSCNDYEEVTAKDLRRLTREEFYEYVEPILYDRCSDKDYDLALDELEKLLVREVT